MLKFDFKSEAVSEPAPRKKSDSPMPLKIQSSSGEPAQLPVSQAISEQSPKRSEESRKTPSIIAKIRRIKNIEIYLAVLLIIVMIGIYITTFTSSSGSKAQGSTLSNEDTYARELESKLTSTLSQVKGAGKVSAAVTVVGSATIEIAYNIDEKTITQSGTGGSSNTTTTIVKTPVILNGSGGPQPLVLLEIKPKLKGVVIVAQGASDVGVRLNLIRAVRALIADTSVNIEIFAGK